MADRKLQILIRTQFDGKGVVQADREISGLGRSMGQLSKVAGAVGATGLLLKIGKDAIQLASNVEEAASKFQYVFGPAAAGVGNQLDEFAAAANRSNYELRSMAADVGAMTEAMLGSKAAAGDLSVDIAKLAVDLASFHNVAEDEALTALKAGLIGESEPLRRFGVLLSEAAIQDRIFADGLATTKAGITDAMKVQARYAIIMEQTATAQGDAIRTGDSYANQVRGMEAAYQEFAVTLGQLLLPTATAVVTQMAEGAQVIARDMSPAVKALTGEYARLADEMAKTKIAEAAGNMEKQVEVTYDLIAALESSRGPLGAIIGASDELEVNLNRLVASFIDTASAGDTVASQNRAVFESLQAVYGEAVTMERGYIKLNGVTVDYAGNLFDLAVQLQNEAAAAEAASFDQAHLNRTMIQSAEAAEAAIAAIRPYHQAMAEARGPNEELADKQAQLANRLTETEGAIRGANAANAALVEGLRAQKEAAIEANAALVGAFRSQDTTDAIQSLLSAQQDLEDSQGEWVTAVRSSSGQIADINSQLATDLSDEQKRAYQEILNTVGEGSAEWLSAYNALQGDLTESQRAALVAQRAELEASGDQIVNVYTGDAAAAEDAQERIEAANAALIESYRTLAFEGSLALAELSPDPDAIQRTLDYAVAIGAISQEEADLRLEAAQTRLAIEELNQQVVQNGLDTAVAAEAFRLLTEGEAGSAAEAITLAQNLLGVNDQLAEIPGDYTAKVEADTAAAETGLKAVEEKLSQINGRTARAYVVIEESIQSSQQDQSVVGSGGNGGGGRAFGGAVFPNQSYIVGERGPEIFRPSSTGTIIPHNQLTGAAAGMGSLSITVNVEGGRTPEETGNNVARGVLDAARQLGLSPA